MRPVEQGETSPDPSLPHRHRAAGQYPGWHVPILSPRQENPPHQASLGLCWQRIFPDQYCCGYARTCFFDFFLGTGRRTCGVILGPDFSCAYTRSKSHGFACFKNKILGEHTRDCAFGITTTNEAGFCFGFTRSLVFRTKDSDRSHTHTYIRCDLQGQCYCLLLPRRRNSEVPERC